MKSSRNLNWIPDLENVFIVNDMTEIQKKEETSLRRRAADHNMTPTPEMQEKGMVMKVVGPRGQKRIVMTPLKRTEELDEEGRVRWRGWEGSRRRERGESREQEKGRCPATGANTEPLGRKEQGNGQGAAGVRRRREEQEITTGATGMEQLHPEQDERTEQRFQSSGSGEGEGRGRKGREKKDYPSARRLPVGMEGWKDQWRGQGWEGQGGRSRTGDPECLRSSSLLLPRVSRPVTDLSSAKSGSM